MSNASSQARRRGLRAALATVGRTTITGSPAITTIVIRSVSLLAAVAATGCLPKWGPPAPPAWDVPR